MAHYIKNRSLRLHYVQLKNLMSEFELHFILDLKKKFVIVAIVIAVLDFSL